MNVGKKVNQHKTNNSSTEYSNYQTPKPIRYTSRAPAFQSEFKNTMSYKSLLTSSKINA